jgi:hypothetical protein
MKIHIILITLLMVDHSISFVIRATVQRKISLLYNDRQTTSCDKNTIIPCLILVGSLLTTTMDNVLLSNIAYAYGSDYASETVFNAVKSLTETIGDEVASFKSLENIGDIITEGKGVGGSVSYCRFHFQILIGIHE